MRELGVDGNAGVGATPPRKTRAPPADVLARRRAAKLKELLRRGDIARARALFDQLLAHGHATEMHCHVMLRV